MNMPDAFQNAFDDADALDPTPEREPVPMEPLQDDARYYIVVIAALYEHDKLTHKLRVPGIGMTLLQTVQGVLSDIPSAVANAVAVNSVSPDVVAGMVPVEGVPDFFDAPSQWVHLEDAPWGKGILPDAAWTGATSFPCNDDCPHAWHVSLVMMAKELPKDDALDVFMGNEDEFHLLRGWTE